MEADRIKIVVGVKFAKEKLDACFDRLKLLTGIKSAMTVQLGPCRQIKSGQVVVGAGVKTIVGQLQGAVVGHVGDVKVVTSHTQGSQTTFLQLWTPCKLIVGELKQNGQ